MPEERDPVEELTEDLELADESLHKSAELNGPIKRVLRLTILDLVKRTFSVQQDQIDELYDLVEDMSEGSGGEAIGLELRAEIDRAIALASAIAVRTIELGNQDEQLLAAAKELGEMIPSLKAQLDEVTITEEDEEEEEEAAEDEVEEVSS